MKVSYIGIITGGALSQKDVNASHAQDIGKVLEEEYKVAYYNLAQSEDIDRLIQDRRENKLDIMFNNSAGKLGGDGTVEGFLEVLGIPFVGSSMLATALAFDKKATKAIVAEAGVPVIKGITVSLDEYYLSPSQVVQNVTTSLGYPVVVKASRGSDSIGVSVVKSPRKLIPALTRAFKEDDVVLIEEFIQRSAEITCMVFGNGIEAVALDPVERVYNTEIFTAGSGTSRRKPECDEQVCQEIMKYSSIAHMALGCSDYSRSDFILDKAGSVFFLELNGHAGLGKNGSTEYAARSTYGWEYPTMIKNILERAISRYR